MLLSSPQGEKDDLVHVMSSLLSTAVKAAAAKSCRSRPLSRPVNRFTFLNHVIYSSWEGEQVVDLNLNMVYCTNMF